MPRLRDLSALFENAGTIVVPPGEYHIDPTDPPVRLHSGRRVLAHGAVFRFPERLGSEHLVAFAGVDVAGLRWEGGQFTGSCFDPSASRNTWEPHANTRGIVLESESVGSRDITIRDVAGDGLAGAVVSVFGKHGTAAALREDNRDVEVYAENITVSDCTFLNCGKFMWDYGYLWQILGWPEDYSDAQRAMAERYLPSSLIDRGAEVDAAEGVLRVADPESWTDVCLFPADSDSGATLPQPLIRGKRYAISDRGNGWIRIADYATGKAIDLTSVTATGAATAHRQRIPVLLVHNLHQAYMELYAPAGSGPGKGAVDLTACRNIVMSGNRLSARGDTMHIHSSINTVFSGNQILGSRMGAFFLSEWCKNSTITGNTVSGTNGSRVVSVEKSNEDVTIIGNTFRGGGRGSWINQPKNIIIQGNIFVNNTTKCEHDPVRGRRTFETGDYEQRAEMYFTTHETGGTYGPVILHDNIFVTGPEATAAVELHAGGHDISIRGNSFAGGSRDVVVRPGCERPETDSNLNVVQM